MLHFIGSAIGPVAKTDRTTDSKTRGQFARLAVIINTEKPLVSKILIDGKAQRVEYECLPQVCFGCGRFGHTPELCTYISNLERTDSSPDLNKEKGCMESDEKTNEDPFGPRMIVDRRKSRSTKSPTSKSTNRNGGVMTGGSRFGILDINSGDLMGAGNQ